MLLLKNSLYLGRFTILCSLNYILLLSFFNAADYLFISLFYGAILLNHYFLFSVVAAMTGIQTKRSIFPIWLQAILKFLLLIGAILSAMHKFEDKVHIIVGIYIFQLIILVISTKRIVKKN